MADEKQMKAILDFCAKPFSQHSSTQTSGKGRGNPDWNYLVQQISYFDHGHIQKDEVMVKGIARLARKEFPNGADWNVRLNTPGAHEKIISIIRTGLAALILPIETNTT